MEEIGFSTGCMHRSKKSIAETLKFYSSLGADAVEISFATPTDLNSLEWTSELEDAIKNYKFVTIHAPWKEVKYKSDIQTTILLMKLQFLCKKIPVKGIVIHPDTIENYVPLNESGLYFLIENMDARKEYGNQPEHNKEILSKRQNLGSVIDLEHAYENDKTMTLARTLSYIADKKLSHIHVSGRSEQINHALVQEASNQKEILSALPEFKDYPIILEGILIGNQREKAVKELNLIKTYLY